MTSPALRMPGEGRQQVGSATLPFVSFFTEELVAPPAFLGWCLGNLRSLSPSTPLNGTHIKKKIHFTSH